MLIKKPQKRNYRQKLGIYLIYSKANICYIVSYTMIGFISSLNFSLYVFVHNCNSMLSIQKVLHESLGSCTGTLDSTAIEGNWQVGSLNNNPNCSKNLNKLLLLKSNS